MNRLLTTLLIIAANGSVNADVQLDFVSQSSRAEKQQLSYLVKASKMRLDDGKKYRFNLFDQQKQRFISLNLRSGKVSQIDNAILTQRVKQLNKKRIKHLNSVLKEVDKKRPQMTEKELEVTESVVNQLQYPEQYGAYTLNRITATQTVKTIAGIECQQYTIKQNDKLMKKLCIANQKQLGISSEDFSTLQAYEEFNYQVESQIMLAMGESNFDLVSLKQHDISGIIIERSDWLKGKVKQTISLLKISTAEIPYKELQLPKAKNTN